MAFGKPLRLIADDLTGALDSAAPLLPASGPIVVSWSFPESLARGCNIAFTTATRDVDSQEARSAMCRAAGLLGEGGLAFKKIDSLLRGSPAIEVAVCMEAVAFNNVIIAPAYPSQGRWTLKGQQSLRSAGGEVRSVDVDLGEALEVQGFPVRTAAGAREIGPGISLCDARSDADLDSIVNAALALTGRTLWVGTGGLANALGRSAGTEPFLPTSGAMVGLVGTVHPATVEQIDRLEQCRPDQVLRLRDAAPKSLEVAVERINARLAAGAGTLLVFDLPGSDPGPRSSRALRASVEMLDKPEALFVTGGETCLSICEHLGAASLDLKGRWADGVPVSELRGGRWAGVRLFSKSGGFGDPSTLLELFAKGP